jgi:hypothetical protein
MKLDPEVETALRQAKTQLWEQFSADPNITGMSLGMRRRSGDWTQEPVVTVMVAKKRPSGYVSTRRLLPASVTVNGQDWGVDVVQAGPFTRPTVIGAPTPAKPGTVILSDDYPVLPGRARPPLQGNSISNLNDPEAGGKVAGSLGCYVIDNTDDTICLLTCNHVIARENYGVVGDPIIQPGGADGGTAADGIATLKRWVPLVDGTTVDGAIAQLNDQQGWTDAIANNLMTPISRTHPAVGMVVAGDPNGNSLLTRMDATFTALNVRPIIGTPPGSGGGASAGVIAPELFMDIEKVGRTSGYTTTTIMGLNADVKVDAGAAGVVTYSDLMWTLFLSVPGDSGSVACAGGNGDFLVIMEYIELMCELLAGLESYYDIPLTNDGQLSDTLRDNFLSQSLVGRLLITTTYVNTQAVKDRLASRTGSDAQKIEQSYAQQYYAKYHDLVASVLNDPNSTAVVTQDQLDDVSNMLGGEIRLAMLTDDEATATENLYYNVLSQTLGMNRQQVVAYLNDPTVYQYVYNQLAVVPTIELTGPVSVQEPE